MYSGCIGIWISKCKNELCCARDAWDRDSSRESRGAPGRPSRSSSNGLRRFGWICLDGRIRFETEGRGSLPVKELKLTVKVAVPMSGCSRQRLRLAATAASDCNWRRRKWYFLYLSVDAVAPTSATTRRTGPFRALEKRVYCCMRSRGPSKTVKD